LTYQFRSGNVGGCFPLQVLFRGQSMSDSIPDEIITAKVLPRMFTAEDEVSHLPSVRITRFFIKASIFVKPGHHKDGVANARRHQNKERFSLL
jgi:hypothetical protein